MCMTMVMNRGITVLISLASLIRSIIRPSKPAFDLHSELISKELNMHLITSVLIYEIN